MRSKIPVSRNSVFWSLAFFREGLHSLIVESPATRNFQGRASLGGETPNAIDAALTASPHFKTIREALFEGGTLFGLGDVPLRAERIRASILLGYSDRIGTAARKRNTHSLRLIYLWRLFRP